MLSSNELFKDKHGGTFRLLATLPEADIAHVFSMDERKAIPRQWSYDSLVEGLKSGAYLPLGTLVKGVSPSTAGSGKYKVLHDRRWVSIQPLVHQPAIYFRASRGPLIEARAKECDCSPETIWALLRLYWRGGMTKDALHPRLYLSGTEKERGPGASPRLGKPRGRKPVDGRYESFVMREDIAKQIEKLTTSLLKQNKTHTRRHIYTTVVRKMFSFQDAQGRLAQRPLGERPTRGQVLYIIDKSQTLTDVLTRKHGEASFTNNYKPTTGHALANCTQVGQYFEIDATIVDLWIVANVNRAKVIGKATLYLVIDKYSRLIVGFHISLDKPSRAGAMEAMLSLVEDKEKLCRRYGFPYSAQDWPAHGIFPFAFVADRGSDFIGPWVEQVTDGVHTSFINYPARRAPLKPFVESSFKVLQVKLKDNVGGYTPPAEWRERQLDDHSAKAVRTMKELGCEILHCIQMHNHSVLKGMRLPARDVLRGRASIPIDVWNNDVAESAGLGSKFAEDFLRFQLLPRVKADEKDAATVTHHGILFKGLLYECDRFHQQDLFLKARKRRFKVDVTYDRRLVDAIYVHDEKDPSRWDTAFLTGKCAGYGGLSFAEFEAVEDAQWTLDQLADEQNLMLAINFDEHADARQLAASSATRQAIGKAKGAGRKSGGKQLRDIQAKEDRAKLRVLASAPPSSAGELAEMGDRNGADTVSTRHETPTAMPSAAPTARSSTVKAGSSTTSTTRNPALLALLNLKKS